MVKLCFGFFVLKIKQSQSTDPLFFSCLCKTQYWALQKCHKCSFHLCTFIATFLQSALRHTVAEFKSNQVSEQKKHTLNGTSPQSKTSLQTKPKQTGLRLRQSKWRRSLRHVPLSEVQMLWSQSLDHGPIILGLLSWLCYNGLVLAEGQILRQILAPGNTLRQVAVAVKSHVPDGHVWCFYEAENSL